MIFRLVPLLVVMLGVAGACSEDPTASPPKKEDECRLPSPKPNVDPSLIPESFLPSGEADVTQTEKRRGRLVVVMTIPGTIQSVLDEYRSMVDESGFDLLQEDNEGFEAELYLQKGRGDLAVVQIRETGCTDKVLVLLNLPGVA